MNVNTTCRPRVGIATSSQLLGRGIVEAIGELDVLINNVTDTERWVALHPQGTLVMDASRPDDLDRIAELSAGRSSRVVALLERDSTAAVLAAINAGAVGIISINWSTDQVRIAISAVLAGLALVSIDSFKSLASKSTIATTSEVEAFADSALTDSEVSCLRAMARGETVREMAESIGYSEREVYRRLRRLYRRMGVSGRTEAVLRASRLGLLETQPN